MNTASLVVASCLLAGPVRAQEAALVAPELEAPSQQLHAAAILSAEQNEWVYVQGLNPDANRAVLQRGAAWGLFSSTRLTVLGRGPDGWQALAELSRLNGRWSMGNTLSAVGLSADGRYLAYRYMENLDNPGSAVYRVFDILEGRHTTIGPADEGPATGVARSAWFQERFPGRRFAEAFPPARMGCEGLLTLEVRSSQTQARGAEGRLTVRSPGAPAVVYPLTGLYRDWPRAAYAADCSRGLVLLDEIPGTYTRHFATGHLTADWRSHLFEIGRAPIPEVRP